jgi:hypothetical protein
MTGTCHCSFGDALVLSGKMFLFRICQLRSYQYQRWLAWLTRIRVLCFRIILCLFWFRRRVSSISTGNWIEKGDGVRKEDSCIDEWTHSEDITGVNIIFFRVLDNSLSNLWRPYTSRKRRVIFLSLSYTPIESFWDAVLSSMQLNAVFFSCRSSLCRWKKMSVLHVFY